MQNTASNGRKAQDCIAGAVTVDVEKLVYGGHGLARTEHGVILVPHTVPGDSVRLTWLRKKKGVLHGDVEDILKPSEHRRQPFCENFLKGCGGCQWQHIDYIEQVRIKKCIIEESFERIAKIQTAIPPLRYIPHYKGTRIRSLFHVSSDKKKALEMGYYRANTNEIVPIHECPLCVSPINQALAIFQDNIHLLKHVDAVSMISNREDLHIHVKGRGPAREKCIQEIYALFREQGNGNIGIYWSGEKGRSLRAGHDGIILTADGWKYLTDGEIFFQGHALLNDAIIKILKDLIGKERGDTLLDLFCGVGFLSIPFSSLFKRVAGLDNHEGALRLARENAVLNNAENMLFYKENLGSEQCNLNVSSADTVILDPPRRGCTGTLLNNLIRLSPLHIVMVSCNPATMARDVKYLTENGYEMTFCHGLDLFPQTFHIETIVHLKRV